MRIAKIVDQLRNWLGEHNHRSSFASQYQSGVKIQFVFQTEGDAHEARRLYEREQMQKGQPFFPLSPGAYIVEGMTVEFLGPVIHLER